MQVKATASPEWESSKPANPVLELRGVGKSFAGVPAVADVDLTVFAGEALAIVGENGAGKSTLMKIVSGVHPASSFEGQLLFEGVRRAFRNVREAEAAGIVLVPQELHVAPGLSVAENMFMGQLPGRMGFVDTSRLSKMTLERLRFFDIDISPDAPMALLSPSQQRLVTIASALAKSARLVILDEPTAALTDAEAEHLFVHIRRIRREGVACLYISHRLDEIEIVADRVAVMRNGRIVARLDEAAGRTGEMVRAMIGRDPEPPTRRAEPQRTAPVLSLRRVDLFETHASGKQRIHDVSLDLHAGEILGLFGLVGAGRTELAQAMFGAWDGRVAGEMQFDGAVGFPVSPADAIRRGVGMLTEDRKQTGLIEGQSATVNVSAASLDRVSSRFFIDDTRERRRNRSLIEKLDVRPRRLDLAVQAFSGGNQQKILLARWLATGPKALILDEPTLGVDVGARFEIYRLIRTLADEGRAILIVSSDLNEVRNECDRILVMYKGRLNGEFPPDASRHDLMAAATGKRSGHG